MQAGRMIALDGLRGIAAVAVVLFHYGQFMRWQPFDHGYLAVDFFFLLSGFVLAGTYEVRLASGMPFWRYMGRRIRRFYPSIFVGVCLGIAAWASGTREAPVVQFAAAQALLIPPFWATWRFPLNPPQWSLFFELLANGAHAALVRRARFVAPIVFMLGGLGGLVWMLALAWDFEASLTHFLEVGTARVCFSFFGGIVLWHLHQAGLLKMLRLPAWLPMLVLLGILLAPIPLPTHIRDFVVTVFAWPLLLIVAVNSPAPTVTKPGAEFLGRISYPLYATHHPILALMAWLINWPADLGPLRGLVVLIVLLTTIVVAVIVERFIERPLAFGSARPRASPSPAPQS